MLLKVCGVHGATAERDIEMLAAADVDLVGLWHGVPGGDADLSDAELVRLAAVARDNGVEPVMVTFERDAERLARALTISGVSWVQLHAFQLPHVVTGLHAALRDARVTIVKVLHVRGHLCVDLRLAPAFEEAGVDAFLLDAATEDGRMGSTGAPIPPAVASEVAGRLRRPFFLAGGVSAHTRPRYDVVARDQGFVGIDVSTGARDGQGRLRMRPVEAINRAWRGGLVEGGCLTSSMLS
jgi:phosphoribosylanthranilate isomerase